jgi:hypothetical protein
MVVRKFILVVEEDVVTDMTMPNAAKFMGHIDALSNNPRFFEVPIDSEISEGWIWDGNDFHPPII